MNTRSLEQFQRLLTQHTGSEEEPAEGSLLWAAEQLRRIARMLEDMQTGPRRSGAAVPPAPEAMTAPVPPRAPGPGGPPCGPVAAGLPCRRHDTRPAAPDWDSLLPLLPESVRLLRLVLEDDAALHALLRRCGGLTLRIPRRFPAEGHPLRALLPGPALRRLLAAYGGTCLYIPRCARLARQVRQRELLGAFSRHTAAGTSSNAEVRFLARRYGITDRRVWQLLKQEAELPAEVPEGPGAPLRS